MALILVVDDEAGIRDAITRVLVHAGYTVRTAANGQAAIDLFQREDFDLALLDIMLGDMTGIDVLAELRKRDSTIPCVFVTAFGSVQSAVEAMRAGGFDYLTKPFDNDVLLLTVERALKVRRLGQEVRELEQDLKSRSTFSGILGVSQGIRDLVRILAKAAATDATVLLTGESGTGKELAARSLHQQSRRATGPFVAVNCAAIPATLAESEFFGVERGAFTDAKERRQGVFERAHRGTLFLDEIGELPVEVQAKLLRVLQDGEVTRLGAGGTQTVDVRVVAATNRDLRQAAASGQFREDVFWRLNVFPIHLPPLRERCDDVPILTAHLIDRLNIELSTQVTGVSEDVRVLFSTYSWPGNVRELENALRYAMIVAERPNLQVEHFPHLREPEAATDPGAAAIAVGESLAAIVARSTERIERAAIKAALTRHRGSRTAAALALGIGRRTLFNKMRQLRLVEPDAVDEEDG